MNNNLLPAVVLFALLSACSEESSPSAPSREAMAPDEPASGQAPSATVEQVPDADPLLMRGGGDDGFLVDASGSALYYQEGNEDGRSCDLACQQVWPPVISRVPDPRVALDLQQAAVATFLTEQGGYHVTYYGKPLYCYAGDFGAETISGHAVEDEWGHWHLMGADGRSTSPPADKAGQPR